MLGVLDSNTLGEGGKKGEKNDDRTEKMGGKWIQDT
jgi:hypothetical protein